MIAGKHDEELEKLAAQLRRAIAPVGEAEGDRDLWPRMLRRLQQGSPRAAWLQLVPWFDWALLGVAGAALIFFPALIPALLYHL